MAAEDIYAAALGDYYKQIAGNNPWMNTRVADPGYDSEQGFWSNFLTPAVSRLAEGLMQGYGTAQVKSEQDQYKKDLLEMMQQPAEQRQAAFASDPRFADLAVQEQLQQRRQEREYAQKLKETEELARVGARGKAMGEQSAQPIVDYNTPPSNPMMLPEKQREALVPGIGYVLDSKDREKVQKGDDAFQATLAALNTVRELRKAVGVEDINSPENAAAKAAVSDFITKTGKAEELGALDVGLQNVLKPQLPSSGLESDSWFPGKSIYERIRNSISGDPVLAGIDQTEKQLIENYQNKLKGRMGHTFVDPAEYVNQLKGNIGGRVTQDLSNTFPSVKKRLNDESKPKGPDLLQSLPVVGDLFSEQKPQLRKYRTLRNPQTGETQKIWVDE